MLFLGTLFTAPLRGLLALFEEVHHAVNDELKRDREDVKQELIALYNRLETGTISEAAFDQQEKILLDKLDELTGDGDNIEE